jgi:hypothetical protein
MAGGAVERWSGGAVSGDQNSHNAGSACAASRVGGRVERRYAWRRALDRQGRSARKFCPKVSSGADPNSRASAKPNAGSNSLREVARPRDRPARY